MAIPVSDLERSRRFYTEVLGCTEGRTDTRWVDLNFFGHQVVLHQIEGMGPVRDTNPVDGHDVPVPHFGIVLEWENWHQLVERLRAKKIQFVIEPNIRFKGQSGEQATCFFLDPDGQALEFKTFRDLSKLFATRV